MSALSVNRSHRVLLTTFLFGLVVLCQPLYADKLLRWKLQPGQTLQLDFEQDMDMNTSLMGNKMRSSANMGMAIRWEVAEVSADGVAKINQSIQRLTMKMRSPGEQQVEFDTLQPVATEGIAAHLATAINPLVGVGFVQHMTNRGEVVDVDLTEESARAMQESAAGEQLQQLFSQDGLQALLGQAATVLPHHPIKPGDHWTGTSDLNSPAGKLVMETTYTYVGTETQDGRPLERIDVEIDVDFGNGPNALGLDVEVSEQNNKGTIYFDEQLGQFASSDIVQEMTMETKLGEQTHRQQLNTRLRMKVTPCQSIATLPETASPSSVR